jgi:hypothetical protein
MEQDRHLAHMDFKIIGKKRKNEEIKSNRIGQGILNEREGSIPTTSSLRHLLL